MNKLLKVLIIDDGARGHSMARKFDESPLIDRNHRYIAPGNGGALLDGWNILPFKATDIDDLAAFAEEQQIDFTFVGQEAPLVNGIVNKWSVFRPIWAPSQHCAMYEGDKKQAKELMDQLDIPTARPWNSYSGVKLAHKWLDKQSEEIGWAIKYRFLAAGKGVLIAHNKAEAHAAVDKIETNYGPNAKFLIEPLLPGREISLIGLRSKSEMFMLPPTQDYKRVGEGGTGFNGGGMGCYSPVPWFTPMMQELAMEQIIRPITCKVNYQGTFYGGLMIDNEGKPSVVEINCRGGDPETVAQNEIVDGDLLEYMYTHLTSNFPGAPRISLNNQKVVVVVLCSEGYPDKTKKGMLITGLENAAKIEGVKIIHAGTALENGNIYAIGGRVIDVVATGNTFAQARAKAYTAIEEISWDGMFCRHDIAQEVI